ncbi:proprotein convertase P-domain-containing protein [Limnohabitans sp. 2KL-17]|uniref:proprotein convertase P-domain-containing protein n=1 Tax=Limnohabitans sp. 2KL-17 TaxID=1100704 RepID=UPI001304F86F|nr:proprotein convertase P-domain-containing protein [Limnohabitans sp. 2KL-17]
MLSMTFFMASCGGGGSDVTPNTSPDQVSCGFVPKYADGFSNGSGRPINLTATTEPQPISQCSITSLTFVTVGLCLKDAVLSELTAKLTQPNNTEISVALTAPASAQPSCLTDGTLMTFSLPAASINQTNGLWKLSVTDTNNAQYNNGYLVGWSLQLTGNR